MITKTIRGGLDSYVRQDKPRTRYGKAPFLGLCNASGKNAFAYLHPGWKPPRGTVVISAKWQLYAQGSSSGSRTISMQLVNGKWTAARVIWNNRPGVTGTVSNTSVTALSENDLIEVDVTSQYQSVADGAAFFGFRVATSGTTLHRIKGWNAGGHQPRLVVQYAYQPTIPTGLTSGAVVSTGKPFLHFDYNVFSGTLALASVQVQIDPAKSATPAWDSGEVASSEPGIDLATTGDYPGLASGATTYWRVRYKTTDGLWSPWSAWGTFSRVDKGVLTIDAPGAAPNDLVTESTPPFLWTFSDQEKFQVLITPAGQPSQVLHDSGVRTSSDQGYTPPSGVITTPGARYTLIVRVWDAAARVATAGDPTYVEAQRDFTFAYSADTVPVTALTATRPPTGFPRLRLAFQLPAPPDSFIIERDGQVVADNIDPDEVLLSGSSYAWEDWTARPFVPHTYRVVPVVNGKAAADNIAVTSKFAAYGVWVGDPAAGYYFNVIEADFSGLAYGEDAEVTPNFAASVRKISSMRGLEGPISGVLVQSDFEPRSFEDQLADVWSIKGRGQRIFRILVADVNAPVLVGDVSPAPSSDYIEGIEQRRLSFSVWQQGELPFTPIAGE